MSAPKTDDLEAVRTVVEALKDFPVADQQRIVRWAAEKLGMTMPASAGQAAMPAAPPATTAQPATPARATPAATATDIKMFMAEKKPRNDVQYAAAVAYYYRFEAPPAEKKDVINKDDLQSSSRSAGRNA